MLYVYKWVCAFDEGVTDYYPPLSTQNKQWNGSHLNTACWNDWQAAAGDMVNNIYADTSLHTHSIYTHALRTNLHNVYKLYCIYSQWTRYFAWFTSNGWNEVKAQTVLRNQTLSHGTAINNQHGHYLGCLLLNGPHTWFESAYPRHVHLKLVSLRCLKSLPLS